MKRRQTLLDLERIKSKNYKQIPKGGGISSVLQGDFLSGLFHLNRYIGYGDLEISNVTWVRGPSRNCAMGGGGPTNKY